VKGMRLNRLTNAAFALFLPFFSAKGVQRYMHGQNLPNTFLYTGF